MADTIDSVLAATISCRLAVPVTFGDWEMRHREFALVAVRADSGLTGYAYTLTRDGAVAEQIRKSITGTYVGSRVGDQERTYRLALRRNLASHSSGIGLRALSIVDLATWDLAAKAAGLSIASYLGGRNRPMPATAIVGYPPSAMGPDATGRQVADLYRRGWRRFKMPIAASDDLTAGRLRAARSAAPDAWIGLDAAWIYDDVDAAARFIDSIQDVRLGWFEDVFPPGDARVLRRLRERIAVPLAHGDEQGGSYFPEALIEAAAVDVVRIDLTCMGGISGGRPLIDRILAAGLAFAPHMFPHVHGQVLPALGHIDVPIEWGLPGTGVHPMDDPLPGPAIGVGGSATIPEDHGFGRLASAEWIRQQEVVDDPGGLVDQLEATDR